MGYRIEKDSLGEIQIPKDALYGAATQRAAENFPVSNHRLQRSFLEALGLIKWAAAKANANLAIIDHKLAGIIADHALQVSQGDFDNEFIVDVFQTGSGTSTNMNVNEVIANLANLKLGESVGKKSPVHPNDHVNRGQSSNDVIPSAIHLAACLQIKNKLLPNLKQLETSLANKSKEFSEVIKIGRTHLQDATPVTLGQEFSGYAQQITNCRFRIDEAFAGLTELAIGGTAVGTGLNTHPEFAQTVCKLLTEKTKIKFIETANHFEAQAAKDACVFMSSTLKTLAVALMKIANDLRWLNSGPRTGIGEIRIPELQAGSSIMPGKNNPVICESIMQISAQVQGNDLTIQIAGQHGNFELNTMMPVIAYNLLDSIELLANGCKIFSEKCIDLVQANLKHCEKLVEQSLALITSLTPILGYDQSALLAKTALKEGKTIRELLEEEKILPHEEIDRLLDPKKMLAPHK